MTVGVRVGAALLFCVLAVPTAWAVMGPSGKPCAALRKPQVQ